MSNQYPGFHTHENNGYPGQKGQKGDGGFKGEPGQHGRVTEVQFAFTTKTPADLNGNQIPKNWDSEGSPLKAISMRPGESVVYTVDGTIWTYLPQVNSAGWANTGTVSGDVYTVPGAKGEVGDGGQKGESGFQGSQGEKGEKGMPGRAALKGEQGEEGPRGFRGEKGNKGDTGLTGPEGEKGIQGETGAPGENGFNGVDGIDGIDGVNGEVGPKGEPGDKGETPGIETVPVMIVSYDAVRDLTRSKFNLDTITKLETGHYRFRMKDKTRGSEMAATVATALSDPQGPILCYVTRQTARVVEIKTCDLQGTLKDTTMNIVMYNPPS